LQYILKNIIRMIKSKVVSLKKFESYIGEMENAHKSLVGESEGKWQRGNLRVCAEILLKRVFNKMGQKCVN